MDFTPIIPTELNGNIDDELLQISEEICTNSAKLVGTYSNQTIYAIKEQLRKVNSYYSNLIESEGTHPINIDKAQNGDYSEDSKERKMQKLSLAHIDTQEFVEAYCNDNLVNPFSANFTLEVHNQFYSNENAQDFLTFIDNDKTYTMVPGKFREDFVSVGNYIAPDFQDLNRLMEGFEKSYKYKQYSTKAMKLIYALCSHHRLVWIHPFLDGNGRVSRLMLDGALINMNLEGYGLWNISRGLARDQESYKNYLKLADTPRLGDLDGRGKLSTKEFKKYLRFMLETALDQVEYMSSRLKLSTLLSRVENYILNLQQGMYELEPLPKHSDKLLKELFIKGEIPRGKVQHIIGTKDRVASSLMKTLTERKFIKSDTPRGNIKLNLNSHFASKIFPELVPDVV